jgi:hypothetical protein
MAALDSEQNLKAFAAWRDGGQSAQPNVARRVADERQCTTQELGRGEALLAFELEFEEFEPGVGCAGCEEAMVFDAGLAGFGEDRLSRSRLGHAMHDQLFCHRAVNAPGQG